MARQKTSVQTFLEEQLKDREFAESFYQGLDELRIMTKNLLDRGSNHAAMTAWQRKKLH